MPTKRRVGLRRSIDALFDDAAPPTRAAQIFNAVIAALIFASVGAVILDSVESVRYRYEIVFERLEETVTGIFALEYVARVWTSIDLSDARSRHPLWGRLRYISSFFALIDLAAILPVFLGLLGAGDLRVLRLLRLLRMLKLTRHSTVFSLLWAVLREQAKPIAAVLFILLLTLTISASLMYMLEAQAQPQLFSSIPAAMWWAIETVTTVGYGDMVPVTIPGKVLGGVVSVIGIGTMAIFSGLITVSFMDQLRRRREAYHRTIEERLSAGPLTAANIQEIERIGDHLAIPAEEAAETVETAIAEWPLLATCPHCGYSVRKDDAASAATR